MWFYTKKFHDFLKTRNWVFSELFSIKNQNLISRKISQPSGQVYVVFTDVHWLVCFIDHSVVRVSEDHLLEGVTFLPSLHRPVVDVVADETFYRISEIYINGLQTYLCGILSFWGGGKTE